MTRSERFTLRLTDAEADRLERFVAEDPEFDTPTAFVRWCVFDMGMDRWRAQEDTDAVE